MGQTLPSVESFFPFWGALSGEHKEDLLSHSQHRVFKKGEVIAPYKGECLGLMLVQGGQFRAFVLSDEGKEVTLYRLYEQDICIFSAACVMNNIQFDIHILAEKDTETLLVPSSLFERLLGQSLEMANYTNRLMASRFSDVMWTLEQVLFKSMDCRLAQVLMQHAASQQSSMLSLTHEAVARDMGTAREVVSRLLKYFQNEELLRLTRGSIQLLDEKRLVEIANC